MLAHWEGTAPRHVFLRQPVNGKWQDCTWSRAAEEAARMAAHLKSLGLPPGSSIAIFSKNCAHWILSDLAIWMSGHVSVPVYPNLHPDGLKTILQHAGCRAAFIGKLDAWEPYRAAIPAGLPCIGFPYGSPREFPDWDAIISGTAPLAPTQERRAEETATLIYTSGTTGDYKGVVHTYGSIAYASSTVVDLFKLGQDERFFSYLPLAHVAERLLVEGVGLYTGGRIAFAESLDTFADNLRESAPTIFLGVPRIWEKFRGRILEKVPAKKLDRLLAIPVLSSIIRRKMKTALGLHHGKYIITGAAPTPQWLIDWFGKIGIRLLNGYGMTENFAYSHLNHPDHPKAGTVGVPWPGVEVKRSEEGEILMRSPALMSGYFKDPELTAKTLRDGWLHTGDLGEVDADGSLRIGGRVKDLFKTSKGKYVAPSAIEAHLTTSAHLDQVCVVGSSLSQPIALAVPSEGAKAIPKDQVARELAQFLEAVNQRLSAHERLDKVILLSESWTTENQLLTPTLKVRRASVELRYQASFESWLRVKEKVLWA